MVDLLERNRWLVVIGAILIQLALGAIYAWSAFTKALTDVAGPYGFTAAETAIIFSVGLATFALVMVGAGKLLPHVGPRPLTIVSALVLGGGYIAAGYLGDSFLRQVVYIGLMGGAGIGIGYVVPIAVGVKWFPDKKGLITGLGVAGFGFGATIWVKLAGSWAGLVENLSIAGLPGVQSTFIVYGVAFAVLVLLGSLFMQNPRKDWRPNNWEEKRRKGPPETALTAKEMLRTWQYRGVFSVFLFSALAGLMVIYSIKLFGMDTLELNGVSEGIAATVTGTAMAWYAIFNGLGRIAWGTLSDKIGRRIAVTAMVLLQGITMLSTYHIFVSYGHELGLVIVASIIGFNFGGNFALMPAWTADLFGNKHVGSNYPWVFIAYGIAGIFGPLLAGYFGDLARESGQAIYWMAPYLIAGVMCLVSAYLALRVRKPDQETVTGEVALENA